MNYFGDFCLQYFALICLSMVMIANAVAHFSTHRRISLYSIGITASCILLAVSYYVQTIVKPLGYYWTAMLLSILGYILRPTCLYFFICMNKNAYRGKYSFLLWIPLVLNAIVYFCALIPGTRDVIFGFEITSSGSLAFGGGPLRFTSHIISFLYMAYLIYISIFTLKSKHLLHGITILGCAAFVIVATVLETFFNSNDDIELLNITVLISTLAYYLFLYNESSQIDTLTGLFNRETYYKDLSKMESSFTAIIQFDVNGLKHLNDNYGHSEGDLCLSTVAKLITERLNRNMYGYRMGGDEFLVIVNNTGEDDVIAAIDSFKEALAKTKYHCSVGYAMRKDGTDTIESVMGVAEEKMYADKSAFYKNSEFERRKI